MGRESSPLVKLLWICANRRYLNSFRNSGYSVIIFGFQPDTFSVFALCTFQLGKIKSSRHRRVGGGGARRHCTVPPPTQKIHPAQMCVPCTQKSLIF
jgi:hypothetical protein